MVLRPDNAPDLPVSQISWTAQFRIGNHGGHGEHREILNQSRPRAPRVPRGLSCPNLVGFDLGCKTDRMEQPAYDLYISSLPPLTGGQLQHFIHLWSLTKRRPKNFIQKQAACYSNIERIHAFFHWDANDMFAY